jgi:hypothetical protein
MPIRQDWQNMNLIQTLAVAGLFLLAVQRICSQKTYHPNGLTECWITAIRTVTCYCPMLIFLQSKNPKRFLEFINHPIMERVVFCTTIETNRFYPEIMNNAPKIGERVEAMEEIASLERSTMVTAEPLMQFDHEEMASFIRKCKPKLVNIGRNSCRRIVLPEPTQEEVQQLIAELKSFAKVNVKDNALEWCK